MKKTTSKASFGSIASGSVLPEDTIPAFCDELRRLRGSVPAHLWRRVVPAMRHSSVMEEDGLDLANDLLDALGEYAPPYGYFGAHPGDCADFGFWLCEDFQQRMHDDGVLEVSDTSQVPEDYSGEVLHVSDHGNPTLYAAQSGTLTEVWSLV